MKKERLLMRIKGIAFIYALLAIVVKVEAQSVGSLLSLGGEFEASSGIYRIPIMVSPGSHGVQPNLSVVTSQGGGNGILGWGFTLNGLSSITPVPKNLYYDGKNCEVRYGTADAFVLDGVRLISTGSNTYTPVNDPYTKVVYSDGRFTVASPNGVVAEYGGGDGYATFQTPQGRKAYAYALRKITDPNGNYMLYTYEVSGSEYRIRSIGYTGNGSNAPYNAVEFAYGVKNSMVNGYVAGENIARNSRISAINVRCEGGVAKQYTLSYSSNDRLTRVDLVADGITYAPTTIEWHTPIDPRSASLSSASLVGNYIDFDGDGKGDVLSVENGTLKMGWSSLGNTFSTNLYRSYISLAPPLGSQTSSTISVTNVQLADVDGSGTPSVLISTEEQLLVMDRNDRSSRVGASSLYTDVHLEAYTPTPSGVHHRSLVAFRLNPIEQGKPCNFYPIDINADGAAEIFTVVGGTLRSIKGVGTFPAASNVREIMPMNFDGDANTDVLLVMENGAMAVWGFQDNAISVLKTFAAGTSMAGQDVLLGDFNGDGLSDILCRKSSTAWKMLIGTGLASQSMVSSNVGLALGSSRTRRCSIPLTATTTIPDSVCFPSQNVLVHDMDGDNCSDIVYRKGNTVEVLCASKGWATATRIASGITEPMRGLVDARADGVIDIMLDTKFILFPESALWGGMVNKIYNGLNGTAVFGYGCFHNAAVETMPQWPLRHVRGPFPHLKYATCSYGSVLSQTWQYTHSGGIEHAAGIGFLGFKNSTVSNSLTGERVSSTCSFTVPSAAGSPKLYACYEVERVCYKNSATVSTTTTSYTKQQGGNSLVFRMLPSEVVSTAHLTGVTSTTSYGYHAASGMLASSTTSTTGWSTSTAIAYNAQAGLYRPTSQTTTTVHNGETFVHATSYTYTPTYPLRVASITEQGTTTAFNSFDAYGNPTTITRGGRTATQGYDGRGRFVNSVTNAAGLTTTYRYRNTDGLQISTTDANGLSTASVVTNSANGLKLSTTLPNATASIVEIGRTTQHGATFYRKQVAPSGATSLEYVDAAGRTTATDEYGLNGTVRTTLYAYNTQGQLHSITYPGVSTPTVYSYNAYGKVATITGHNRLNEMYTYDGLTTVCVSQKEGTTTTTHDAMGNVVSVNAPTGEVTYTYAPNGKVGSMVAYGATSAYQYDSRGNVVTAMEANRGTRTYTYSQLNEVLTETDADGQCTTYQYDKAGRLLKRSAPGYTETFKYSSNSGTLGLLESAMRTNDEGTNHVAIRYAYDPQCRLVGTTTSIGGISYTSGVTYNAQGLPDVISYPTGVQLVNTYDPYGHLKSIGKSRNDTQLWTGNAQDARGQWTSYCLGNGLSTQLGYDAATLQLATIEVGTPQNPTSLQSLSYSYNAKGLLKTRSDHKMGLAEEFSYDAMDRLTTAAVGGQPPQTTAYSDNGNISGTSAGAYTYGNKSLPHAVTGISGVGSQGLPVLATSTTYSADQQLTSASNGSYGVSFALYPGGARARATYTHNGRNNGYKVYVDGCEFLYSASGTLTGQRTTVQSPTGVVAVLEGGGSSAKPTYVHTDNLGSWVAFSNASGGVVGRQSFDAWGRPRSATTWEPVKIGSSPAASLAAMQPRFDRGFTGHEHLLGLGLVHMNGRIYDPYSQRVLSPDPVLQNPFNAQNHNRYSYCLNSPLRYTDPSGYYFSRVENLAPRMDVPIFHDPMLYSRIGGGGGGSFYPNTSDGYTDWVTGGTTADMVAHAWNSTPDGGIMSYFYTNGRLDFSYAGMAISGVEVTGSWDNGRWHTSSVRYPDGWGGVAEGHGDELATASTIFGAVGVAGDVTSMSNSTFRIMSGANGTFSLKIYNSGWNGGSPAKITTYSLSKVGTGVSTGASVVTTYISYNQIYNGEALPITYVDAGVGTAGILAAGASYFYGVQIPVVGEFVAVYGALRLTWDVSFYLGTQYGPSKWYGTNDNKWFK